LGNVQGKTFLHLQCHFGMDTLSWARKGAVATGVDMSDESIKLATKLSEEIEVPATFVQSDVYDLPTILKGEFDIVFTSYGVLGWLPDLKKWASVINHFLKKGGTFYIAEIHPLTGIFDRELAITDSYFRKEPHIKEFASDYVDDQVSIDGKIYNWAHPLSEVFNVLKEEGLTIEYFHEFPFTVYDRFPGLLKEDKQRYWRFKDSSIEIPLLFSL
jgi:ubiquinone/menaquinone biosynthesis C-methylase UbiE